VPGPYYMTLHAMLTNCGGYPSGSYVSDGGGCPRPYQRGCGEGFFSLALFPDLVRFGWCWPYNFRHHQPINYVFGCFYNL
jgi:hypothetical protein